MSPAKSTPDNPFPADFLWGASTAAHQVEGHQHNDWSVWEASVAGKLAAGAESRLKEEVPDWESIRVEAADPSNYISGDTADHFNRYEEDFDILKSLGLNAFRLSIEWARVEPEPGTYDEAALDHYEAVLAALKKRDITPVVTLHHFTNPRWLESHGGWHGPEVVERFAKYSEAVARRLGNQAVYWCTINEPGSYLLMRYLGGGAWPEWPKTVMNPLQGYRYLKNLVKIHQAARSAIQNVNPAAQVGLAVSIIDYQLGRRDPVSWLAKKQADYVPDTYLLNRLKNDSDFIGVNYYMRMQIKAGLSHPQQWAPKWNGRDPRNDSGWGIYPEGLYNVTQKLKRYGLPQIVTENGVPDAKDAVRARFIRDHIDAIARSSRDGADIRGYLYWSLLDNYEWSEGYWPKFGLVSVDRRTMKRTVRPSAYAYAELIKKYQ